MIVKMPNCKTHKDFEDNPEVNDLLRVDTMLAKITLYLQIVVIGAKETTMKMKRKQAPNRSPLQNKQTNNGR